VDLADSLLLFLYALAFFAISAMLMHSLLCVLFSTPLSELWTIDSSLKFFRPQGQPDYTPYFLVVANIIIIHKLLDTNITLTCPPTLPYDKGVGFS
jgi:hypothetical protein